MIHAAKPVQGKRYGPLAAQPGENALAGLSVHVAFACTRRDEGELRVKTKTTPAKSYEPLPSTKRGCCATEHFGKCTLMCAMLCVMSALARTLSSLSISVSSPASRLPAAFWAAKYVPSAFAELAVKGLAMHALSLAKRCTRQRQKKRKKNKK